MVAVYIGSNDIGNERRVHERKILGVRWKVEKLELKCYNLRIISTAM